jgi:hypothetical protein
MQYKITSDNYGSCEYPTAWKIQGSDDGSTWTTLSTQTGQSFTLGQTKTYTNDPGVGYIYYRIQFTAGNSAGELKQVQFLGTTSYGAELDLESGITYDEVKDIKKAQNFDSMFLTHQDFAPKELKRTSANTFSLEEATFTDLDFSEVGNPNCCAFSKGRLWLSGFSEKPTTAKASKVGQYYTFTVPSSNITDSDALSLTFSELSDPITWIYGGKRNLIVGNSEGITVVNGGTVDTPITSTAVNADLANREGASSSYPTEKDSKMIYISNDASRLYSFDYELVSESFVSTALNLISDNIGEIEEIYYKRDNNNLLWAKTKKNQLLCVLYNASENIIGFFPIQTNGEVVSIASIVRPDGKDDLFICVLRNNKYYIERLADEVDFTSFYDTDFENDVDKEKFNRIQCEELKNCVYLDGAVQYKQEFADTISLVDYDEENKIGNINSASGAFLERDVGAHIVYKTEDGSQYGEMEILEYTSAYRVKVKVLSKDVYPTTWGQYYITFRVIGDLEDIEGEVQSVVADGGYIGDYTVVNGKIELDKQYTVVTVGYKYKALAKTFNIGTWDNGVNTQTMKKKINKFTMRFFNSAGGKVGTDIDNLQKIQTFNPNGYYDLPPLLMNGDVEISGYNDSHTKEKFIYFVQDEPLPLNLTMLGYTIQFEGGE